MYRCFKLLWCVNWCDNLYIIVTYIYAISFHFFNPSKPLGLGYETCPQDLRNTIRHTLINQPVFDLSIWVFSRTGYVIKTALKGNSCWLVVLFNSIQFILLSFDPKGLWPVRYGTCQYRNKVTNIHDVRYNTINLRKYLNRQHSDCNVAVESYISYGV